MAEATIQLGGGNWAGKSDNILGYYKEGERFYKQDFTFSRSTSGTRVNSSGLIETANVLSSELVTNGGFDTDSDWNKLNGSTISGGFGTVIAGGNVEAGSSNWSLNQNTVFSANKKYKVNFRARQTSGSGKFQASRDYYFFIDEVITSSFVDYSFIVDSGSLNFTGNLVFGGRTSGDEFEVDNVSVKEVIQNNIPRVSYLNNSNGSLILEPQRTNLITNSNSNSLNFTLDNVSMTYNSIMSPDGETNGILFEQTGSANSNSAYNYGLTTTDGTYSYSLFIKAKDSTQFRFYSSNGASTLVQDFNPLEMTEGILSGNLNLKFEDYGNGWFRVSFTRTLSSAAFHRLQIYPDRNNTQKGVYIFGLQVESGGNYATSYIPTSGSSVTRNADVCSITDVADRIGQTKGTLYSKFDLTEDSAFTIIEINLGNSTNNRILAYRNASYIVFVVQVGGAIEINNSTLVTFLDTNKIAVTYQTDDFKIYLNGSLVKTYTSGSIPSGFDTIDLQDNYLQGRKQSIKDLKVYKEILTNSELTALTTL